MGIQESMCETHERLEQQLINYRRLRPSNVAEAKAAFFAYYDRLKKHIAWEEDVLFPVFLKKAQWHDSGPIDMMRYEHRQIVAVLDIIYDKLMRNDLNVADDERKLEITLSLHTGKEEHILYPIIERLLTEEEADRIAAQAEDLMGSSEKREYRKKSGDYDIQAQD